MSSTNGTLSHIRVAKLQWCNDVDCPKNPSDLWLHLKVEYEFVEIVKSFAIAVSYTWGDFDRCDVIIGHDAKDRPVSMNLGREWNIQDTVNTLVEICLENGEKQGPKHAGVWIDQLCIKQTDEDEVRATLASIPMIYRSLDVVALMPGGNCSCLPKLYAKLESGEVDDVVELLNEPLGTGGGPKQSCVNAWGLCSYFDRVWTRQELLYSGSIRIVRTEKSQLHCVRDEADAGNLIDYSEQKYKSLLQSEGENSSGTFGKLFQANSVFFRSAFDAVEGLKRAETGDEGALYSNSSGCQAVEKFTTGMAFFMGKRLERPYRYGDGTDAKRLLRFLGDLELLGTSTRKATKARDYVISVWPDCPGYVLPEDYKTMDFPSLLENAIRQLERTHSVTIQTSWLAGLFMPYTGESFLWRPKKYLGRRAVQGAGEIYGIVLSDKPLYLMDGRRAPLSFSNPAPLPFSNTARRYSDFFSGWDLDDILDMLKTIIQKWDYCATSRISLHYTRNTVFRDGPVFASNLLKFKLIMEPPRAQMFSTGIAGQDYELLARYRLRGDFDHHQAVYEMVAVGLGLNARDCKNAGLELMLVPGQCIGFTKGEVGPNVTAEDAVTVLADPFNHGALIEAAFTGYDPVPVCSATGIWVPFKDARKKAYGARVSLEGITGLLE